MRKLVVLACSKTKIWMEKPELKGKKIIAKDAYTGSVFRYGLKYAQKNNMPFIILSGKYGLLEPEQLIEEYDFKLNSFEEAEHIRGIFKNRLKKIFHDYDSIFLIGGDEYYRRVFQGFDDKKFGYLKAKNPHELRKKVQRLTRV